MEIVNNRNKMMKQLIFIGFVVFFGFGLYPKDIEFSKDNFKERKDELKEALKNIDEGDKFFEQSQVLWKDAIPFYLKANEFNQNNAMLNYKLGAAYLHSAEKAKALAYL